MFLTPYGNTLFILGNTLLSVAQIVKSGQVIPRKILGLDPSVLA